MMESCQSTFGTASVADDILRENESTSWSAGYRRFSLLSSLLSLGLLPDLHELQAACSTMPLDPYDECSVRHRLYGRAVFFPWRTSLEWIPDEDGRSLYFQGEHNPEHVGKYRTFESIPDRLRRNRALQFAVNAALTQIHFRDPNDRRRPLSVGVHMVSQRPSETRVAKVSPSCMHQDGEMFDYVFLLSRENVVGGLSCVARADAVGSDPEFVPADAVIERFVLENPFDGFGVDDVCVSHGVTPVSLASGCSFGHRNTLLVDITPMIESLR